MNEDGDLTREEIWAENHQPLGALGRAQAALIMAGPFSAIEGLVVGRDRVAFVSVLPNWILDGGHREIAEHLCKTLNEWRDRAIKECR